MRLRCLKMAMDVYETHLEGRVSQNFDIGLSLNFIACRSGGFQKNTKNSQKLPVFCSKTRRRRECLGGRPISITQHVCYRLLVV